MPGRTYEAMAQRSVSKSKRMSPRDGVAVRTFRHLGHDVVTSWPVPDEEVRVFAAAEGRIAYAGIVVCTYDPDF